MGDAIKGVATGGMSLVPGVGSKLGGALGLSGAQGDFYAPQRAAAGNYTQFANNYDDQMRDIEGGIQNGALTKGVYGDNGLQSQLGTEGQQLANQGFNLTQGDQQAYGQASGDISRLFGQQDQAAAQSLARRGLGSAASGAAGATYSGLAGNKNEMLAKAQTDIAQKRMQDTQSRLMQNRQLQAQIAATGGTLSDARMGQKGSNLLNAANLEQSGNNQTLDSMNDQRGAKGHTLGEALGAGLFSSAANIGATPGKFVSAAGGAAGKSAGSGMFGGAGG